jgi:hypothetical protein
VAAAVLLTPTGVVLIFIAAHSSNLFAYIGAALLFPSFLMAQFSRAVSIPGLTRVSPLGITFFVALQLAYYYVIVRLLVWLVRKFRTRNRPSVIC